jgi:hypothetical protein
MSKRFLAAFVSLVSLFLVAPLAAWAADPEAAGDAAFNGRPIDPAQPVVVHVVSPQADTVVPGNDVDVFVQTDNYVVAPGGNAVHLLLDNGAPQILDDLRAPRTLRNLPEGGHTLRVLVVRPDGTALANPEAYTMIHFFVRRRDFQNFTDPAQPYLTVNLPLNSRNDGDNGAPLQGRVWLDFRAQNAPLAKEGGYVVRCTINQNAEIISTSRPVYWDNLQPGRYDLTAELLTSDLRPVSGVFNRISRTFEVQTPVKAMPSGPTRSAKPVSARVQSVD